MSITLTGSGITFNNGTSQSSGNFGVSNATDGYQRTPDGLLIQWGVGPSALNTGNNGGSMTVTFPVAFSTVYQCVAGIYQSNTGALGHNAFVGSLTNTNFNYWWGAANNGNNVISATAIWIAIGV
jgi:hypothetical protein